MTDKYRVHDIAKFYYSDIGEYIDEKHTDRPLRNDILVEILNEQHEEIERLKEELDAFKPVMFQDMRKGNVLLYTKRYGDVE